MATQTRFRLGDRARAARVFRALPQRFHKEIADALEENAKELVAAIERRVPADGGDLAASVRWAKGKGADRNGQGAGRDADISVRVIEGDRNTFYAGHIEHGTVHSQAQPHFFPTYRQLKRRLAARLRRAVTKAVNHVAAMRTTP